MILVLLVTLLVVVITILLLGNHRTDGFELSTPPPIGNGFYTISVPGTDEYIAPTGVAACYPQGDTTPNPCSGSCNIITNVTTTNTTTPVWTFTGTQATSCYPFPGEGCLNFQTQLAPLIQETDSQMSFGQMYMNGTSSAGELTMPFTITNPPPAYNPTGKWHTRSGTAVLCYTPPQNVGTDPYGNPIIVTAGWYGDNPYSPPPSGSICTLQLNPASQPSCPNCVYGCT